jgi:hypothetical protein
MALGDRRQAQGEGVGDRHVDRDAGAEAVVRAGHDLGVAVVVAQRRLGGADADGADRGVTAKQRPLRTARHFDRVHVVHQHGRALGARRVDAVHIDGDFRVGHFGEGGVVADAAHGDQDRALVALLVDGHRRHELGQVGDVLDLVTVEGGSGRTR